MIHSCHYQDAQGPSCVAKRKQGCPTSVQLFITCHRQKTVICKLGVEAVTCMHRNESV